MVEISFMVTQKVEKQILLEKVIVDIPNYNNRSKLLLIFVFSKDVIIICKRIE